MSEALVFDAAVEVGIAAFCAGDEPPSDDEVWDRLIETGVAPWLAERLLILLPMAYGRRWVSDIAYSDVLAAPGGRVNLSEEPVFVAAVRRAQQGDRHEFDRIAPRSSEFKVINDALRAGGKLPDLILGETQLVNDWEPIEPGDGGVPSPRVLFEHCLREHGVAFDGAVRFDARLLVHPSPVGVVIAQVEFAVAHPAAAGSALVESATGLGTTWGVAIGQAVNTFMLGALHPIVAGLLRPGSADDHVQRERYEHPDGVFDVVLGPQINMFTDRPVPPVTPLFEKLLNALRGVPLTRKVHGLRLFIAYRDGELATNEILLDYEQWPGGNAVVADSQAPLRDGYVAIRIFSLLVPVDAPA
ncbi:hypothetical protein F3087_37365 [Nocardia colli]|uniref:Uncharacterized protein n=1 Tax=Nocardia colli TaxID=2545717 RepID=A0A5N0E5R8_9NOCA|nr:DUF6348 family protein [Nocardia colli]KAA8883739.1 hypothetical protein F3087_37365 [Nocardia colli]